MTSQELSVYIGFARLELIELEAGKRTLSQCPGIEKLAQEIARIKSEPKRMEAGYTGMRGNQLMISKLKGIHSPCAQCGVSSQRCERERKDKRMCCPECTHILNGN